MKFDLYLEAMLNRQRGRNHKLFEEIKEKISEESKERLFRILQDMDQENQKLMTKIRKFGL